MVLAAEASRYDARLLWIVVQMLATAYDRLNPLALRRVNQKARWPQALGVAFEFARAAARSEELEDVARFVAGRILPARGEQFFIATRALAGAWMERTATESLAEYKRWGYLGTEIPVAKELGVQVWGTLAPTERRNVLRRLGAGGPFTAADYLHAVSGSISRRQAERDLKAAGFLMRKGRTRAARYLLRAPPYGLPR